MQHAQARRANSVLRDKMNGCSVKMNSTMGSFNESSARARARTALYAAIEPRLSPSEVMSKACRINRPKSRYNAPARRSMKKPCFSSEMLQRSSFLRICIWRFADLEVAFIVINKTRDSVEKAKASRTHLSPYDAATPSLASQDNVATKSATDSVVSDARSMCSRVIGDKEAS